MASRDRHLKQISQLFLKVKGGRLLLHFLNHLQIVPSAMAIEGVLTNTIHSGTNLVKPSIRF